MKEKKKIAVLRIKMQPLKKKNKQKSILTIQYTAAHERVQTYPAAILPRLCSLSQCSHRINSITGS